MRVVSGTARGRPLKAVPGHATRPTSDKVKESVFNMIGPYFAGGHVLDLFAGTGALGIEALSRGAEQAVFVDKDRIAVETVKANLHATRMTEQAIVLRMDAQQAIGRLAADQRSFAIIFLDPPYRMKQLDGWLASLVTAGIVATGATVVLEHDTSDEYPDVIGAFGVRRRARYGDTAVTIYEERSESPL